MLGTLARRALTRAPLFVYRIAQVLTQYEENRTRYVVVLGRDNDRTRTVTLKLVHQFAREKNGGRAPTIGT